MTIFDIPIKEWIALYGPLGALAISGWAVAIIGIRTLWAAWQKDNAHNNTIIAKQTESLQRLSDTVERFGNDQRELIIIVRSMSLNRGHGGR